MTDEALEQRLRAWYRAVDAEAAPVELRASVASIATAGNAQARLMKIGRAFTLLAAAALGTLLILSGAFVVGTKFSLIPSPSPSASAAASPAPSSAAIVPSSPQAPVTTPPSTASPSPTPEPTPVPLIAVYHALGDTAEIFDAEPRHRRADHPGNCPG